MKTEVTRNFTTTVGPRLPPPYSEASIIGQTCFLILIIVAAFLGNSLVVGAVLGSKKLRKSTNYFIVSLALSDILIALTVMSFHVHHNLNSMEWNLGAGVCQMWIFMDLLCSTASITNVALISIDRFLALTYPFKYPQIVNCRRCLLAIATVWSYSAILSSLSFKNWSEDATLVDKPACAKIDSSYYLFSTIFGIFFPLVILVVAYSLVFRLALRQAIAIKALSTPPRPKHREQRTDQKLKSRENMTKNRLLIRELKATKTLMIVVGTFLICWFPLFVLILVQQYCLKCIEERLSSTWQQIIGIAFVYILPRLNSAVNPIIYSIFNRDFRSVFCLLGTKVANVFPRVSAIRACPNHGNGGSFMCAMRSRREAGDRSTSRDNSAFESNTEYFGFSFPNEFGTSRSPSTVFAFQNVEICYYESSV